MRFFARRAVRDILENRLLNAVTVATIALSVLIVSAFGLLFVNVQDLFDAWKKGVRIMVYLEPGTPPTRRAEMEVELQSIPGIQAFRFISKAEAMALMKARMQRQAALLASLRENPLPDAYEVTLAATTHSPDQIEALARQIEGLAAIAEVEYGKPWIERFAQVFNLFKLVGYGMGALFFIATVFICANTIRLVLYARREEVQIMRLVGATDRFINTPFYLQGMIQGCLGALVGLGSLYLVYHAVGARFEQALSAEMITIRFFSMGICAAIVAGGMTTGLLGSFFSLKQFLRTW